MRCLTVCIPDALLEAIEAKTLDIHSLIIDALVYALKLPAIQEALARLEAAREVFREAKRLFTEGRIDECVDLLRRALRECIKGVAARLGMPEYLEAQRRGFWSDESVCNAARRLAGLLGEERLSLIIEECENIRVLREEKRLTRETVEKYMGHVEWLLEFTTRTIYP